VCNVYAFHHGYVT